MTTTIACITAFCCQVADHLAGLLKPPEARLWPSEVVTLGRLHALTGVGNRPFSRWLTPPLGRCFRSYPSAPSSFVSSRPIRIGSIHRLVPCHERR